MTATPADPDHAAVPGSMGSAGPEHPTAPDGTDTERSDAAPEGARPTDPERSDAAQVGGGAEYDWPGEEATAGAMAVRVLSRAAKAGGTRIVAVDGQSGAGKTTFAAALAKAVEAGGATVSVVHTDDLLDGWDDQFTFWERLREQVIDPIVKGEQAAYRRYDWIRERFDDDLTPVPQSDVVIVEGVSAAREDMRRVADLTVFLRVSEDEAWRRLRARDPEEAMPFLVAWKAREGRHFAGDRTAEQVDVVIDEGVPPTGA
jgi:molybdopterin-guanine dinucleotide biosynthesis protein